MLAALVGAALAFGGADNSQPQPTPELIYQSRKGRFAVAGDSALSADGRYVLISSSDQGLVPQARRPHVTSYDDLYVFDRARRRFELINVRPDGQRTRDIFQDSPGSAKEYPGLMGASSISGDGRYVLFYTAATDLTGSRARPGRTVSRKDKPFTWLLRDRKRKQTRLIDKTALTAVLSRDGLTAVTVSAKRGVSVHDIRSGRARQLKLKHAGKPTSVRSPWVRQVSSDGRRALLWEFRAGNRSRSMVVDLISGEMTVHADPAGSLNAWDMSDDGTRVIARTQARLLAADTNNSDDCYLLQAGAEPVLISADERGRARGVGTCKISDDGQTVAFSTYAQLSPEDTGRNLDVYLRPVDGGPLTFLNVRLAGEKHSGLVDFTSDGRELVVWAGRRVLALPLS